MTQRLPMKNHSLRDKLRGRVYLETNDDRFIIIHDWMALIGSCYRFIQSVLAGHHDANLVTANTRQKEVIYSKIKLAMAQLRGYAQVYVPGFFYNPAVAFFLEQYRLHPISKCYLADRPDCLLANGMTVAEMFLDFVRVLKDNARKENLRGKIADEDAKIKKNKKRSLVFEKKLFERYESVAVVRLDARYCSSRFSPEELRSICDEQACDRMQYDEIYWTGDALEGRALPAVRVGIEEVQADRVKLFANMKGKPTLFKHLIGYVWRIEYGPKAGFHLHLMLAFDGAHVRERDHESLSEDICEYWEQLTDGRGFCHNCNTDWDKTSGHYGLGLIHRNDEHRRRNFRERVLSYLAKPDQGVLVRPYKGCKLTGSGFVHRALPVAGSRWRSRRRDESKPPVS